MFSVIFVLVTTLSLLHGSEIPNYDPELPKYNKCVVKSSTSPCLCEYGLKSTSGHGSTGRDAKRGPSDIMHSTRNKFPNPIPIVILTPAPNKMLSRALHLIMSETCIKFLEVPHNDSDRMEQSNSTSLKEQAAIAVYRETKYCYAECCGYQGRRIHAINLTDDCDDIITILHLLLHILGLGHEHNRPDRDRYIYINAQNVIPGLPRDNYVLKPPVSYDYRKFDYDPLTIMHYKADDFAIDRKVPTLFPFSSKYHPVYFGYRTNYKMINYDLDIDLPHDRMNQTNYVGDAWYFHYLSKIDVAKLNSIYCKN